MSKRSTHRGEKGKNQLLQSRRQSPEKSANEQKIPSEQFSEEGRVRKTFPARYPDEHDLSSSDHNKGPTGNIKGDTRHDDRLPFNEVPYEKHVHPEKGKTKDLKN